MDSEKKAAIENEIRECERAAERSRGVVLEFWNDSVKFWTDRAASFRLELTRQ